MQLLLSRHQAITSQTFHFNGTQPREPASPSVQTATRTAAAPQPALLQSVMLPFELPAAQGLPSDAWRPHVFSNCVTGMPQGYAPCLNYSNLIRGEELVYPGEMRWQAACT
jgi:hypothetical protein